MNKKKWYWWFYPPIYKNNKIWRAFRVLGWVISVGGLPFLGMGILFFIFYFGLVQRIIIYILDGFWYAKDFYLKKGENNL